MPGRIEVSAALSEDAAEISSLYKRVWDEYKDQFPKELRLSRQPSPREMKKWLRDDVYFIVRVGESVVGVAGCRLKHGTCLLTHMAVDRAFRRRGIGSALLSRSIEFAKENNASKVWLDTVPFLEDAVSLYVKSGFEKCGHMQKHFWGLDVEFYELIL